MSSHSSEDGELRFGFDTAPMLPRAKPSPASRTEVQQPKVVGAESKGIDDAQLEKQPGIDPGILTVGQLTRQITVLLEEGIGMVWVEGEISNLRRQASGHSYFTLKDEESQLSCVLFARTANTQKTVLRDGLQVQLYGQVSVYKPRGQYQLMVRLVHPKGEGALQARFEELKRRLSAEGLFSQERKRPMPRFPRRIGVVTSPTGAAIRDFLQVLHRRNPGMRVVISPVRVQGRGAAAEIAAAISEFSSGSGEIGPVDVIVVTRGGGSLEDLWEFNEEVVARAISASSIPVVSAVGHEIDFSIADFVADLRAPTPSAAAELLAADGSELIARCRSLVGMIGREALTRLERERARTHHLSSAALFRDPLRRLNDFKQTRDRMEEILDSVMERRIEQLAASLSMAAAHLAACNPSRQLSGVKQSINTLGDQLSAGIEKRLDRERRRLDRIRTALAALNPEATLARGFSITRNAEGKVLTASTQVKVGERILTRLLEGEIESEVRDE